MPWHKTENSSECPDSEPWAVVKDDDGEVEGCHETEEGADAQLVALYASEERTMSDEIAGRWESVWGTFKAGIEGLLGIKQGPERAISSYRLMDKVWDALYSMEDWAYPLDVYFDESEQYLIVTRDGKLFRVDFAIDGDSVTLSEEWVQVKTEFVPTDRAQTIIRQQEDGQWRWFAVSAASVLNRVGEIDSRDLFDDFVKRIAEGEEPYPPRDFYHVDGEEFEIGMTDYVARDDNLLLSSGLFYDTPLAVAVRSSMEAEPEYWGDSIKFLPKDEPEIVEIAEDVRIRVFRQGVLQKISSLPEERAASLFTLSNIYQEVSRMDENILEELERLRDKHGLPQEFVDAAVSAADSTNRQIEDDGLITRTADEDTPVGDGDTPVEPVEPASEEEPLEREVLVDDTLVDAISRRMLESDVFASVLKRLDELTTAVASMVEAEEARNATVAQVTERLATLEQDEGEKKEEWLQDLPANSTYARVRASYQPREANAPENGGEEPTDPKTMAEMAADRKGTRPVY